MIARLSVVDIGGDAGGHIIAGLETNTLLMQAVHQPLQRVQWMPQDGSAGAALDHLPVQAQFHRLGGKVLNLNFDAGSTLIHYVERELRVPYRFDKSFTGTIREQGRERGARSVI